MTREETLLRFLRSALWGKPEQLTGREMTQNQFQSLMQLAQQQTVTGLVGQALMDSGLRLPRPAAAELYALTSSIRQRNEEMNETVVKLCKEMERRGIRIMVFKGQTLAPLYPAPLLRQSGDIDFICHPEDWDRAEHYFREEWNVSIINTNSEKHVEFQKDGIQYEMHRTMTDMACPKHQRYWEKVVMPEIWETAGFIEINGTKVPTLSPIYNIIYVFEHVLHHFFIDGVGLRQFCDWAMCVERLEMKGEWKEVLEKHLEGIGLRKAFAGMGAILTDYLGLKAEDLPFSITEEDHRRAPLLLQNIWEMGNFGKNVKYSQARGVRHGLEHLVRIYQQARQFSYYAPAEAWWHIPYMFRWWGKKIRRMVGLG